MLYATRVMFRSKAMKIATVMLFTLCYGWGQTSAGDIAFLAWNSDGGDDIAFVALVDISASAQIYFTDNEWNGSAFTDVNEGELTWTNAGSTLSAGSVVVFTDPISSGTANVGTLSGSGWNLGASNEWIYALLSAPATSYGSPPTFLAAMANDAGSGWLTNTGLTEGTHAIDFNDDNDGYEYTGARTGQSSFSDYLTIIHNSSNWQIETADGELILPISTTAFSVSGSVDDPTSFSASAASTSQINLSWSLNSSSDDVIIVFDTDNSFTAPTNGQTYSGSALGGTVIYNSDGTSYNHTSLSSNTTYYYKAWSVDGSNNYSSGVIADASTLKDEPTNHPTSFSASASYGSISITWTDAVTGDQAPGGYLILGETDATITNPSDGTSVSDDTNPSGNAIAKNVTHGSGGSYTFTSLTANTTWYFEIFSYTNSGSTIDYKTDGTIATANATTGSLPNAWINEIHYDNDGTDANEGIEIALENPGDYTLSDFTITLYNGGDGGSYGTHTVDGFTAGSTDGNFRLYYKMISGIQNGAPDAIALDYDGALIQFLSYEGSFSATDGVADGSNSTDIGVSESAATSTQSLQLTGNGTQYSDFSWEANLTQTWGTKNDGGDQSLPVELSSFKAESKSRDATTLTWVTESEFENLGFILERRTVGSDENGLNGDWIEIASYLTDSGLRGQGSVSYRTEYSYLDKSVKAGTTYDYRLGDVDYNGNVEYHSLMVLSVGVSEIPVGFILYPAYPNPFNPTTTLRYDIPEQSLVTITIYDVIGRKVRTLVNGQQNPGYQSVIWDATDQYDKQVSAGMYLYQIKAGDFVQTKKMILLK